MRIAVKLFSLLKDKAGAPEVAVDLPEGAHVAAVLEAVGAAHPGLAPYLPSCRVALDLEFASPEDPVPAGAEVALIPPVSGG